MKYYYTNAQNQPTGPVPLEELQALLSSGAVSQYANIIPVGGQQWVPITSVVRVQPAVAPTPVAAPVQESAPQQVAKPEPSPAAAAPEMVQAPVSRPEPVAKATPTPTPAPVTAPVEQAAPVVTARPTPSARPAPEAIPAPVPAPQQAQAGYEPPYTAAAAPVNYIQPAPAAPAPQKPGMPVSHWPTFLADSMAAFLERARSVLSEDFIKRSLSSAASSGQMLVLAGALVGLLMCTIQAFKPGQLFMLFIGLAVLISVAVLQYVAKRYLESCGELIKNSPSKMASSAFLDCLALISLLASIFVLLGGLIMSISASSNQMMILMGAVAASLALLIVTMVALHPRLTNTTIAPSSSGEEAMGILSFAMKVSVALAPMTFFITALLGFLSCTISLISSMTQRSAYDPSFGYGYGGGPLALLFATPGASGLASLVLATLSPFIIYLVFLLLHLQVDIIKAIVSLPGKLDALRERK